MTQHQPLQPQGDQTPAAPAVSRAPGRLLVIDDDPSICALIAKLGERVGFAPTSATSFEQAIQSLRATEFDCITLDLQLGAKNGVQMLRFLADMACKAPIIVISGSQHTARSLALKIGHSMKLKLLEPVPKPIDLAALRTLLAHVKERLDFQRNAGISQTA